MLTDLKLTNDGTKVGRSPRRHSATGGVRLTNGYRELARLFESKNEKDASVTLSEAAFMKFLSDMYFWKKVVHAVMAAKKEAGLEDDPEGESDTRKP